MGRGLLFFHLFHQWRFHDDIAALAPVLFACARRPAQLPAVSCPGAPFARWVAPAVFRESSGNRRRGLQRFISSRELAPCRRPDDGGGSTSKERAAARSFLRHEPA